MSTIIEKLLALADHGSDLLHWLATCVCIPLLATVVTADVIMRYLFNAPFDW
jgi:TRAP-type C4-dicarboxylate transport system permease small subunit